VYTPRVTSEIPLRKYIQGGALGDHTPIGPHYLRGIPLR